jgi:hypothetical protein
MDTTTTIPTPTDSITGSVIRLSLDTIDSTAITALRWQGVYGVGDLFVTYTSGGTYHGPSVCVADVLPVLTTTSFGSIGAAVARLVGHRKGARVA